MRLTFARAAVSAAALFAVSACSSNSTNPVANLQKPYNSTDYVFATGAPQASEAEIAAAMIAQQRSTNTDVLQFAALMISDHTTENNDATPIDQGLGIVIPSNLNTEQSSIGYQLQNVASNQFDATYINDEITSHTSNLNNNYLAERGGGSNAQLLGYEGTYQPQIQSHLTLAQSIKAKYGF